MQSATAEKKSVALSSVWAAAGLTTLKIVIGIASGSLGILAEAAHSALDFAAAFVTFLAVRVSGKPADKEHPYGHGKVETLSALLETLLLLVTCAWVAAEAVKRLFAARVEVDASAWAFGVMVVSIVVDMTRSRLLSAAAKKHGSEALEADALHFSTDVWSSAVVIVGLLGVRIAEWFPSLELLKKADALAAIIVAVLAASVSLRLGRRTVDGLMDTAPVGAIEKVKAAAEAVDGVLGAHSIRVRRAGPYYFADLHIVMAPETPLQKTYETIKAIEAEVKKILPGADVTVRPQPKK